jgi:hypothetical protein
MWKPDEEKCVKLKIVGREVEDCEVRSVGKVED